MVSSKLEKVSRLACLGDPRRETINSRRSTYDELDPIIEIYYCTEISRA
jgi:hypothetical protein